MISIIIPTLNESRFLRKTIEDILTKAHNRVSLQIIVIDAGSTDDTLNSVKDLNIAAYSDPSFQLKKYESLNFGIEKAKGDYLLFLDADTILPEGFDHSISELLSKPNIPAGAFEFSFQESGWRFKVIELINRVRYRFGHIYYGDQAVFCTKEAAIRVGGFPKKRLMETAYFCQELKKYGQLSLIKNPVKTSARRFIEDGFFKVCWFDFTMWVRFLFGLSVEEYGLKYWSSNLRTNE
ncbi:MAG: glycosyltransferase [Ekhidna sp.]